MFAQAVMVPGLAEKLSILFYGLLSNDKLQKFRLIIEEH